MDFKLTKKGFFNNDTAYTFGSNLYPIALKRKAGYITYANTKQMPDSLKDQIDKALTGINMPIGRCYDNSNNILNILKKVLYGYKIEFYSGWCFTVPDFPIHHSFIMIEKKYIIDTGIRIEEHKLLNTLMHVSKNIDKVAIANSVKNLNKTINKKKFSESYVCGQSLSNVCYYASPDNYENAVDTSNYIISLGIKHPSMAKSITKNATMF